MECLYGRSRCDYLVPLVLSLVIRWYIRARNSNYQTLGIVWNGIAYCPGTCRNRMVDQICSFNGFQIQWLLQIVFDGRCIPYLRDTKGSVRVLPRKLF